MKKPRIVYVVIDQQKLHGIYEEQAGAIRAAEAVGASVTEMEVRPTPEGPGLFRRIAKRGRRAVGGGLRKAGDWLSSEPVQEEVAQ